jgi:hypothetical protein
MPGLTLAIFTEGTWKEVLEAFGPVIAWSCKAQEPFNDLAARGLRRKKTQR